MIPITTVTAAQATLDTTTTAQVIVGAKGRNLLKTGGWLSAIGVPLLVAYLKDLPVGKWLLDLAHWLWHWMTAEYSIQHWYAWALGVGTVAFFVRWVTRDLLHPAVTYEDYDSDNFLDIRWKWEYSGGMLMSGSVTPYCPDCHCRMVLGSASTYDVIPRVGVRCGECGFSRDFAGYASELQNRVGRLVEREIESQAWRAKVLNAPKQIPIA